MDASEEVAPEVRSIIDAARERGGADGQVQARPRSLPEAFARAEDDGRVPTIAEVKPTSPTTARTREDNPVALAEAMVAGGAAALSVLTEPEHFGGSPETLKRVRAAVDVPVLRKDFLLYEEQLDVVEADLVLLIVRFLEADGTADLEDMLAAAHERGFQVLVETHSREEVRTAVDAGAKIIGVNNRDLGALDLDLSTFEEVAPTVPDDVTLIAESGIETRADVARMRAAGADGQLVGSAIMDGDVRANTERLTTLPENTNT
ncbi:indole-3-glycerol phosphate synthase [Halorhabdus rudnickae]|uniref:indole-3-glycerol phosphate synthase n=1 Tax=Halorhabdus rudnickae TaxID=1775544 RepID=UPI0010848BD4|nr:indole-3-glycerol phosphate synthase [Halorhabdus rudnickae]